VTIREVELPPLAALLKELAALDDWETMEDEALAPDEVLVRVPALEVAEARDDETDPDAEATDEERDAAELMAEDMLLMAELSLDMELELALAAELSVEDGRTALVTEEPMLPPMDVMEERTWAWQTVSFGRRAHPNWNYIRRWRRQEPKRPCL
jgi:hypothetical protein